MKESVSRHLNEEPKPVSSAAEQEIPAPLEQVIMACLEKDPSNRPETALDLLHELEAVEFKQPWTRESARAWWRQNMAYDPDPPEPPEYSFDIEFTADDVEPVKQSAPSRSQQLDPTVPQKPKPSP